MSLPFTQRYPIHLLPGNAGLSPVFGFFDRADTDVPVTPPTIFEVGGAGNGQGWYYFDWPWGNLSDPDIVFVFEGTTPYNPATAWLDSISAFDVIPVAPGPAANKEYEFHFQPTDTGLTPAFTLYKRLDTGADVAPQPTITEIGNGFYKFSRPFTGSTDPDIVFLINGNAPGAIDPSKAWYGWSRVSDQYAAGAAPSPVPSPPIVFGPPPGPPPATIIDPIHDLDITTEALGRLIQQYQTPNTGALIQALAAPAQDLEDALFQLLQNRWIATAVGAQLDVLGAIVGQARQAFTDTFYRLAIQARVLINRSSGGPEQLYSMLKLVIPAGATLALEYFPPASFNMTIGGAALTYALGTLLASFVRQARAAGVGGWTVWSDLPPSGTFTLDSGPGLDVGALANAST